MQLELLKDLRATAPDGVKPQIERGIKLLSCGIFGQEAMAFELQNSYLPIDYLIITTKFCLVIKCKKLFGNLEVSSRELNFNGKLKKEGIYSPITQNARHTEIIKRLRMENKKNQLVGAAFKKSFGDFHRSVIVLDNPKTVINLKRAPKAVKDQIIRS